MTFRVTSQFEVEIFVVKKKFYGGTKKVFFVILFVKKVFFNEEKKFWGGKSFFVTTVTTCVHWDPPLEDHNTKPVLISCAYIKCVQSWGI